MRSRLPRPLLAVALAAALAAPTTMAATAEAAPTTVDAAPSAAEPTQTARTGMARMIDYRQWATKADFAKGRMAGLRVVRGTLRISRPIGRQKLGSRTYAYGRWTSPWVRPGFGLNEMVPSWDATTRGNSWMKIEVRGRTEQGQRSSWDTIARWAPGDDHILRTSLRKQTDDYGRVEVDTWKSNYSMDFTSWRLRATLLRRYGTHATPFLDTVGAMTSKLPQVDHVATSDPGVARGIILNVPKYSQMTHVGQYPKYGGGGEAWCSPTSTSMVLGYFDRLPSRDEYSWVKRSYSDRFVDHAARMTYDYRYNGTGNWPFNTAYAAGHAGHGFVTRLRSLKQAERFIRARIPVVTSIAFGRGELDGAPIGSTNGHLLVVVGFTKNGDVVVNDPAAQHNKGVRRTYDRGQFENAWLPKSGGLAYIIRTGARALPARHGATNW